MDTTVAMKHAIVVVLSVVGPGATCDAAGLRSIVLTTPARHVNTESLVPIIELAKLKEGRDITSVRHTVDQVGIYHRGLSRFILGSFRDYPLAVGADTVPGLLQQADIAPQGMPYERHADGRVGLTYESQFVNPGIYVIKSHWTVRERGGPSIPLGSTSLILFVEPADQFERDAKKRLRSGTPALVFQEQLEDTFNRRRGDEGFHFFILPAMKMLDLSPLDPKP